MQRSLTACENEVALVVVKGIKRKLHRLADDRDVTSNFIVNSLVSEDLKSTHLKEFILITIHILSHHITFKSSQITFQHCEADTWFKISGLLNRTKSWMMTSGVQMCWKR